MEPEYSELAFKEVPDMTSFSENRELRYIQAPLFPNQNFVLVRMGWHCGFPDHEWLNFA